MAVIPLKVGQPINSVNFDFYPLAILVLVPMARNRNKDLASRVTIALTVFAIDSTLQPSFAFIAS